MVLYFFLLANIFQKKNSCKASTMKKKFGRTFQLFQQFQPVTDLNAPRKAFWDALASIIDHIF